MEIAYKILFGLSIVVAVLFAALVFLTGKGDAMSGGGGIRTTYKGKANFDDFVSRLTLILGVSFMALMLIIDAIGNKLPEGAGMSTRAPAATPSPASQTPANPTPANPAPANPSPSAQ